MAKEKIEITGVWLRAGRVDSECGHCTEVEVLLEIDGEWKQINVQNTFGPISHIFEVVGIKQYAVVPEWLKDEGREG